MARKSKGKIKAQKYGTATVIGGTASNAANLERDLGYESLGEKGPTAFDTPVCITVVSYRTCLADSDGISAKAAIDGLVLARIIEDDSTKFVEEVRYRQIKVETKAQEKTVLEIEAVGSDGRSGESSTGAAADGGR
jgi:hypothetical protein